MGVDDPRCVSSAEDVRYSPLFCVPLTVTLRSFPPPPTEQWLRETIKAVACGGAFPSVRGSPFMVQNKISHMLVVQRAVPRTARAPVARGRLFWRELGAPRRAEEKI